MKSEKAGRYVSTLLILLATGLSVMCAGPVYGADSSTETMRSVVLDLRELYMDTYPDVQELRMFRRLENSERAQSVKETLSERLENRLSAIRDQVRNLSPAAGHLKKRAERLRRLVDLYARWQRKLLENWSAENPKVYEAFNERELMRKGLAKPDTLRRTLVQMLVEFMNDDIVFSTNPLFRNLRDLRRRVTALNWDVIRTYLKLISRIEQVRGDEEKRKTVRKEVQSEWNTFWNEIENRVGNLRKGLNGELMFFRDRKLSSSVQEQLRERAMKAKRQFKFILAYREIDGVFSDRSRVRDMLVHLSQRVMTRLWDRLNNLRREMVSYHNEFRHMDEKYLEVSNESTYSSNADRLEQEIEQAREQLQLNKQRKAVERLPLEQIKALSERLVRMFGERETKLGKTIQSVSQLTSDAFSLTDKLREYPDFLKQTYLNTSFDDPESFRAEVSSTLEKRKSTIQTQMNDLRTSFSSVKKEVQTIRNELSVSLEDLTEAASSEERKNEGAGSTGS